jgi:hypothetical protein
MQNLMQSHYAIRDVIVFQETRLVFVNNSSHDFIKSKHQGLGENFIDEIQ